MIATSIYKVVLSFSDRVSVGRALDLPVYFGDAGSREVWFREISRVFFFFPGHAKMLGVYLIDRFCIKLELKEHVLQQ